MKSLLKAFIFLELCLFLVSCEHSSTPTASLIPSSIVSAEVANTANTTPAPSPFPTFVVIPTETPKYGKIIPTLVPTVDPTLVPELLSKAFSVHTMEGENGHKMRQITGWEHGFGGMHDPYQSYSGYYWLDISHLLLYPRLGEHVGFSGQWEDLAYQPVVINLGNGYVWLPGLGVNWSSELGLLIDTGVKASSESPPIRAVSTYTFDGQRNALYQGKLTSVSPSRTKIIVNDALIIDLRAGKSTKLLWNVNYDYDYAPRTYWSSDERRVYRCCYHFANIITGESYSFDINKLEGFDVEPPHYIHTHQFGQWVLNDDFFLVQWGWVDNGDQRYIPMFDPVNKIYYDVRNRAAIPHDSGCPNTYVSPDKIHLWLECWEGSYLINLETFTSTLYSNHIVGGEIEWSTNGKFALVKTFDPERWQILSISNQELKPLPVNPVVNTDIVWSPSDPVIAYASTDNKLIVLDAATMSHQELPFVFQKPPSVYDTVINVIWSSNGEKLALVAEDGSIWQIDYPKLENLKQLTPALPNIRNVNWSPDGNSIAFISGPDIYVVEVTK